MVSSCKSPKDPATWDPFHMAELHGLHGGDPNYLQVLGWSSKFRHRNWRNGFTWHQYSWWTVFFNPNIWHASSWWSFFLVNPGKFNKEILPKMVSFFGTLRDSFSHAIHHPSIGGDFDAAVMDPNKTTYRTWCLRGQIKLRPQKK